MWAYAPLDKIYTSKTLSCDGQHTMDVFPIFLSNSEVFAPIIVVVSE